MIAAPTVIPEARARFLEFVDRAPLTRLNLYRSSSG
jgi:hypothetical protein